MNSGSIFKRFISNGTLKIINFILIIFKVASKGLKMVKSVPVLPLQHPSKITDNAT